MTISNEFLDLNYQEEIENDLVKQTEQIKCIYEDLGQLGIEFNENNNDIPIGSRVIIKHNIRHKEGIVSGKKTYNNIYEVIPDGQTSYNNFERSELTNISISYLGKLKRDLWVAEKKVYLYNEILKDSKIPDILLKNIFNIVEVIRVTKEFDFSIISFIMAKTLRSGTMKLPSKYIREEGFYEIEVKNSKIIGIQRSSKYVFENLRE